MTINNSARRPWHMWIQDIQESGTYRQLYFLAFRALCDANIEVQVGLLTPGAFQYRVAELQVLVIEVESTIHRTTGVVPPPAPGGAELRS